MLALLASLVLASPVLASPAQLGPTPGLKRADVIIIVADDVGLADIDAAPTPHIDALAASGMAFRNAFSNPTCSPTRRSLNFGRWWSNGLGEFCRRADENTPGAQPSLARTAKALGYETALFGKWHVGGPPVGPALSGPNFHGYDTWRAGISSNIQDASCGGFGSYRNWKRVDDGVIRMETRYVDLAILEAFQGWWREAGEQRLAVVCFQLAHQPFEPPPAELLPPGTPPASGNRTLYRQMIQALDEVVGRLLVAAGPEDIVIFLGDNGTPPPVSPDVPESRAKGTTFERGIHVPMIVRAPFVRPGQVSHSLVHVADVFPTLAELGGRPLKNGQGQSLLPVLRDPSARIHSHVVCGWHQRLHHVGGSEAIVDRCVRSERYKLRVDADGNELFYDLELDPDERAPIALDDPAYKAEINQHRRWYADAVTTL